MGSFILFLFAVVALAAAVGWYRAREDEFGDPLPSIGAHVADYIAAHGGLGISPRLLGRLNFNLRRNRSAPAVKS